MIGTSPANADWASTITKQAIRRAQESARQQALDDAVPEVDNGHAEKADDTPWGELQTGEVARRASRAVDKGLSVFLEGGTSGLITEIDECYRDHSTYYCVSLDILGLTLDERFGWPGTASEVFYSEDRMSNRLASVVSEDPEFTEALILVLVTVADQRIDQRLRD